MKKEQQDVIKWSNGEYKLFYDSGVKLVEGKILSNKPEGLWSLYFENGQVNQKRFYKNGLEHGDWYVFNEEGDTIRHLNFIDGKLLFDEKYIYKSDGEYFKYFYKLNAELNNSYLAQTCSEDLSESFIDVYIPHSDEWYKKEVGNDEFIPYETDCSYSNPYETIKTYTGANKFESLSIKDTYFPFYFGAIHSQINPDLSVYIYELNKENKKINQAYLISPEGDLVKKENYQDGVLIETIDIK
jgi:hypothetical protein